MASKSLPLNKEEDLILRELILQGVASGKISKHRDFQAEKEYADLQRDLLADLPQVSGAALGNLNRMLSAFPTYSGAHRLVRSAQSSVSVVHAKCMSLADTLEAQSAQATVAVAVMQEINAKHEAARLKERERRARSQRHRGGQQTITSHLLRGPVLRPPGPVASTSGVTRTTRATSAPAQPKKLSLIHI